MSKTPRTKTPPADPDLFDEDGAAAILHVTVRTLRSWRTAGTGPKFSRIGRNVWYRKQRIDEFIAEREGSSNAEFDRFKPATRR